MRVYEGTNRSVGGDRHRHGMAGTWTAGAASPELPIGEHTYTAVAKEQSLAGNAEGVSSKVTFTVDTHPPDGAR